MSKKTLGLDKDGIQKVMRTGDYFADSLGQFSLNVISGLVGQLTYFYTDKVGIAAAAIATMLLNVDLPASGRRFFLSCHPYSRPSLSTIPSTASWTRNVPRVSPIMST